MIPPVDDVSTPLALRTPVAVGRSPVEIGPPSTPAHAVVQPVANTPFSPSEMTPTRNPVTASVVEPPAFARTRSPMTVEIFDLWAPAGTATDSVRKQTKSDRIVSDGLIMTSNR